MTAVQAFVNFTRLCGAMSRPVRMLVTKRGGRGYRTIEVAQTVGHVALTDHGNVAGPSLLLCRNVRPSQVMIYHKENEEVRLSK